MEKEGLVSVWQGCPLTQVFFSLGMTDDLLSPFFSPLVHSDVQKSWTELLLRHVPLNPRGRIPSFLFRFFHDVGRKTEERLRGACV